MSDVERLRLSYEAFGGTPAQVIVDARRIAREAVGGGVDVHVEVGVISPKVLRADGTGRAEVNRWQADCTATADVEISEPEPRIPLGAVRLVSDYGDLTRTPRGYPGYDDPDVQAVAGELLGHPGEDGYWRKTVITNRATALHAAVRAVHVLRERARS